MAYGSGYFKTSYADDMALVDTGVRPGPLVTLPSAAIVGGVLGLAVGAPSLRLKGLYLALGTLAMHFVVLYLGNEYQARSGLNTGVTVPPLVVFGMRVRTGVQWYYVLLALAA